MFGIDPKVAIASDLVNSLAMKPAGGAVHALHGSVNWALVRLLVVPGVPAAFFGAWLLNQVGNTSTDQHRLKTLLGWALVVACASLVARASLSARLRRRGQAAANPAPWRMKPLPTVFAGLLGGVMVGMTSVGAGSLVIVLLMLIYPRLSSKVQVGTNLVQAVPLVAAAALGQALFGHVDLTVAGSLILGSVPGAALGAHVSSRAPDAIVRPALVALLTASGLALLITSYTGLAWAIAITAASASRCGGLWTPPRSPPSSGRRPGSTGPPGSRSWVSAPPSASAWSWRRFMPCGCGPASCERAPPAWLRPPARSWRRCRSRREPAS